MQTAFFTADRSQTSYLCRSMTISREISFKKEFRVVEDQIFNLGDTVLTPII
jgi:hypothetical protein